MRFIPENLKPSVDKAPTLGQEEPRSKTSWSDNLNQAGKLSTSMLNLLQYGQKSLYNALSLTLTLTALFFPPFHTLAGNFSAGFIYDRFPLTIGSGQRTEVLGPLYYHELDESNRTIAFPPFFSREKDPTIPATQDNVLYPLFRVVKYQTQYRAQFLQIISFSGGENSTTNGFEKARRFTIFPLYFQQRGPNSNDNYTAVVPFYGHLKNRLFRDRIFFVMFPIYGQTWKKDVINYNYMYPFFNARHGDGLHGWQFWPLYGSEHKVVTTVTNNWNIVETVGGHDQYFALWPFYFHENNNIGTENPEKARVLIPIYIVLRSPHRDETCILWPFFNTVDDRVKKYREREIPWPFIVIAHGEGKTMTRVFPFFQKAYNDTYRDNFYLWPLYTYKSTYAPPLDRHRLRILFFLYQDIADKNTESGKEERQWHLWPLFVRHEYLDGSTRLQLIAPLESILPSSPAIERNWSPLWSIWRQENNPNTGANSQSFFWNLYRRDASPDAKKISCLFGLYQYRSNPDLRQVRLFYIPVINHHPQEVSKR
jgi:hypothetical protein